MQMIYFKAASRILILLMLTSAFIYMQLFIYRGYKKTKKEKEENAAVKLPAHIQFCIVVDMVAAAFLAILWITWSFS